MEPVTTIVAIEVGAAVVGTLIGGASAAVGTGDSGFVIDDGEGVRYPGQFPEELFVGRPQQVWKPVMSFESDLWWGDNLSCTVMMQGYCSNASDELVCYPESEFPTVPANRFVNLKFSESGDALDHSLLTVNVQSQAVEGDPQHPIPVLLVSGRFDPYGSGDTNYSFQMYVDTYGQISLGNQDPGETTITEDGGLIRIYYRS